jgi:uncharacterized protein (TIGR03086 family)
MSEHLRWYTKALYGFDHVMRLVPDDVWSNPSPCEGWTARHVVGHVVGIQRNIIGYVTGVPADVNPMVDPDRIVEGDPAAAWADVRDTVLETLDHPGVLHRVVTTWRGEQVVDDVIGQNVVDTTVHTWDLAQAAHVDDRLDPGLVACAFARIAPMADQMRMPMVFGPRVDVADDVDAQTALLAVVGRRS